MPRGLAAECPGGRDGVPVSPLSTPVPSLLASRRHHRRQHLRGGLLRQRLLLGAQPSLVTTSIIRTNAHLGTRSSRPTRTTGRPARPFVTRHCGHKREDRPDPARPLRSSADPVGVRPRGTGGGRDGRRAGRHVVSCAPMVFAATNPRTSCAPAQGMAQDLPAGPGRRPRPRPPPRIWFPAAPYSPTV
jgi:hypothetical protein